MKRIVSDINSRPRYYSRLKYFKNSRGVGYRDKLVTFLMILIITTLLIGSRKITAAPVVDNPYFSYKIDGALLAQANEMKALKESLEKKLQGILQEIEGYKKEINKIGTKKRGLQEEIGLLNAKIKKAELEIKALQLAIANLEKRTSETKEAIGQTEKGVERSKTFLKAALKYYYQLTRRSVVEVLLAEQRLSDYFNDFVYTQKLQAQINGEIATLKDLNEKLELQKATLEDQLTEQGEVLGLTEVKKSELQDLQSDRQVVLTQTQRDEKKVQQLKEKAEKTAAQIRAQIYRLAGGVAPINFGEALRLAQIANKVTGIRPAFLLAILDYESKIGKNVGTCNYKDAMKPAEQPIFERVVEKLGLDPNKMLVSCKPWYGWGGAMGPAQFIPSTWVSYQDRVASLTGNNPPSPWNILDAFMAAAIKLTDTGAARQTAEAEWKAAMIYFAGSNWSKPSLKFYGDDVLSIAERFQKDIEVLKESEG